MLRWFTKSQEQEQKQTEPVVIVHAAQAPTTLTPVETFTHQQNRLIERAHAALENLKTCDDFPKNSPDITNAHQFSTTRLEKILPPGDSLNPPDLLARTEVQTYLKEFEALCSRLEITFLNFKFKDKLGSLCGVINELSDHYTYNKDLNKLVQSQLQQIIDSTCADPDLFEASIDLFRIRLEAIFHCRKEDPLLLASTLLRQSEKVDEFIKKHPAHKEALEALDEKLREYIECENKIIPVLSGITSKIRILSSENNNDMQEKKDLLSVTLKTNSDPKTLYPALQTLDTYLEKKIEKLTTQEGEIYRKYSKAEAKELIDLLRTALNRLPNLPESLRLSHEENNAFKTAEIALRDSKLESYELHIVNPTFYTKIYPPLLHRLHTVADYTLTSLEQSSYDNRFISEKRQYLAELKTESTRFPLTVKEINLLFTKSQQLVRLLQITLHEKSGAAEQKISQETSTITPPTDHEAQQLIRTLRDEAEAALTELQKHHGFLERFSENISLETAHTETRAQFNHMVESHQPPDRNNNPLAHFIARQKAAKNYYETKIMIDFLDQHGWIDHPRACALTQENKMAFAEDKQDRVTRKTTEIHEKVTHMHEAATRMDSVSAVIDQMLDVLAKDLPVAQMLQLRSEYCTHHARAMDYLDIKDLVAFEETLGMLFTPVSDFARKRGEIAKRAVEAIGTAQIYPFLIERKPTKTEYGVFRTLESFFPDETVLTPEMISENTAVQKYLEQFEEYCIEQEEILNEKRRKAAELDEQDKNEILQHHMAVWDILLKQETVILPDTQEQKVINEHLEKIEETCHNRERRNVRQWTRNLAKKRDLYQENKKLLRKLGELPEAKQTNILQNLQHEHDTLARQWGSMYEIVKRIHISFVLGEFEKFNEKLKKQIADIKQLPQKKIAELRTKLDAAQDAMIKKDIAYLYDTASEVQDAVNHTLRQFHDEAKAGQPLDLVNNPMADLIREYNKRIAEKDAQVLTGNATLQIQQFKDTYHPNDEAVKEITQQLYDCVGDNYDNVAPPLTIFLNITLPEYIKPWQFAKLKKDAADQLNKLRLSLPETRAAQLEKTLNDINTPAGIPQLESFIANLGTLQKMFDQFDSRNKALRHRVAYAASELKNQPDASRFYEVSPRTLLPEDAFNGTSDFNQHEKIQAWFKEFESFCNLLDTPLIQEKLAIALEKTHNMTNLTEKIAKKNELAEITNSNRGNVLDALRAFIAAFPATEAEILEASRKQFEFVIPMGSFMDKDDYNEIMKSLSTLCKQARKNKTTKSLDDFFETEAPRIKRASQLHILISTKNKLLEAKEKFGLSEENIRALNKMNGAKCNTRNIIGGKQLDAEAQEALVAPIQEKFIEETCPVLLGILLELARNALQPLKENENHAKYLQDLEQEVKSTNHLSEPGKLYLLTEKLQRFISDLLSIEALYRKYCSARAEAEEIISCIVELYNDSEKEKIQNRYRGMLRRKTDPDDIEKFIEGLKKNLAAKTGQVEHTAGMRQYAARMIKQVVAQTDLPDPLSLRQKTIREKYEDHLDSLMAQDNPAQKLYEFAEKLRKMKEAKDAETARDAFVEEITKTTEEKPDTAETPKASTEPLPATVSTLGTFAPPPNSAPNKIRGAIDWKAIDVDTTDQPDLFDSKGSLNQTAASAKKRWP